MSLSAGMQLGAYKILGPLGAGGMGEVYRARDPKLRRIVAVKILSPAFQTDPDRLTRFSREARSLAALNHPNIAAIYGLEEIDRPEDGDTGLRQFIVMELVEGVTLADRIVAGALSVREAVDIARQIAEALDAAHERGIVHRDLKPANIKITADGVVKVLDFGLAKVSNDKSATDLSASPTLAVSGGTFGGVILGTAAYMSPEQARGKPVDRRTDIWSFGCVLFEMLSRRAVFGRETISDTIRNFRARAGVGHLACCSARRESIATSLPREGFQTSPS